jgi:hypothetical protein
VILVLQNVKRTLQNDTFASITAVQDFCEILVGIPKENDDLVKDLCVEFHYRGQIMIGKGRKLVKLPVGPENGP